MKKVLALSLAVAMALALGVVFAHCGGGDDMKACATDTCGAKVCGIYQENGKDCYCGTNKGECGTGLICDTAGACVEPCCNQQPGFIDVEGITLAVDQTPVSVAVAPISPMDALMNPNPTKLADLESGADGKFGPTACFDTSTVQLGLVVLADDKGWDGTGGDFFPTGTGVDGWTTDLSTHNCLDGAKVFVVPNTLVAGMAAVPGFDAANKGFAMGFVVDAAGQPIAGAKVVKKSDGANVALYPNADFSDFGVTGTSATGIYVITDLPSSPYTITVQATGHTFNDHQAGLKGGFCFFLIIQANE